MRADADCPPRLPWRKQGPKKILLSWLPQTLAERRVDYDAFVRADSKDGTLAGLSLADEPGASSRLTSELCARPQHPAC